MGSDFSMAGQAEVDGRIVVVDDDPYVRRALLRLLASVGYGVRTFSSGEEFLASCPATDLDCLIVDVYLAGMSGIDLYEHLAARGTPPPAVFITARDEAVAAVGLMQRPSRISCLCKPFEGDELLAEVASALRPARAMWGVERPA
jgi:two-component system, LuxR family, response regulator FixJ